MAERTPNVIKVIAWFMAQKGIVKFEGDEVTYKLSDAVIKASNFEKFPLKKSDSVEVGLKDNTVTYLRKQKSEAKSEPNGSEEAYEPTPEEEAGTAAPAPEVKKEEPKIENVSRETQELTIFAVSANKRVLKFTELKDNGWYTISEEIQKQDYATIGLLAKNKVKVTFADKMVTTLVKVASEPAESSQDKPSEAQSATPTTSAPATVKKEWKPSSTYDTAEKQTSIEAQAAVNSACQVVGRIAANIDPKPNAPILNNMIKAIAEANYDLIQELKKK